MLGKEWIGDRTPIRLVAVVCLREGELGVPVGGRLTFLHVSFCAVKKIKQNNVFLSVWKFTQKVI